MHGRQQEDIYIFELFLPAVLSQDFDVTRAFEPPIEFVIREPANTAGERLVSASGMAGSYIFQRRTNSLDEMHIIDGFHLFRRER